jgi:3-deoxy-manno-octulosonate cytidylyltransferase (CMP-KDO synthetase)
MPTEPNAIAVIPARWESSRFPGKPLALIRGKPMVQWVVEQTRKARLVSDVIVATDDIRIFRAVEGFGGKAVMTSKGHASGTDRVAEAACGLKCRIVVNVQGDEPLIPPENIDMAVRPLLDDPTLQVASLVMRIRDMETVLNPNIAKVVLDTQGFALYFSRAPIPYDRDGWGPLFRPGAVKLPASVDFPVYQHIGLYAFSKSFLMQFSSLAPTPLEDIEKLEQLRLLANGIPIKMVETNRPSLGVDLPEDVAKIERLVDARKA